MADSVKAAIAKALAEHGVTLNDDELAKVAKAATPAKASSSKTTAKGKS